MTVTSEADNLFAQGEEKREAGDIDGSIELYNQALIASNSTHVASLMQLGGIYADLQDVTRALPYYVKASQLNCPYAFTCLALIYEATDNVEESLKLLEAAVKAGDPEAHYILGYRLEHGEDVDMDIERAKELYKIGSDKGDSNASFHYGLLLLEEVEHLKANNGEEAVCAQLTSTACEYLERASKAKLYDATFTLAETLYDSNPAKSYELYLQCAEENNDVNAMLKLCLMLKSGHGCPQDPVLTLQWLNKAADNGSEIAANLLAQLKNNIKEHSEMAEDGEYGDPEDEGVAGTSAPQGSSVPEYTLQSDQLDVLSLDIEEHVRAAPASPKVPKSRRSSHPNLMSSSMSRHASVAEIEPILAEEVVVTEEVPVQNQTGDEDTTTTTTAEDKGKEETKKDSKPCCCVIM